MNDSKPRRFENDIKDDLIDEVIKEENEDQNDLFE
jgi:hypothetical protein